MINLRLVIIDEPIHVDDPEACELWRKAIWSKEKGYRNHYKSTIIPAGADDFIATHLIVADQKPSGEMIPVAMYKSLRLSQSLKFNLPFGALQLLKGTQYENSRVVNSLIKENGDISYDSSWTINPTYKISSKLSLTIRDCMTTLACNYHLSFGFSRWIAAGSKQYKVDQYLKWLGCEELLPEFSLSIIDGAEVQMMYHPNTKNQNESVLRVAEKYQYLWDTRILFKPTSNATEKVNTTNENKIITKKKAA